MVVGVQRPREGAALAQAVRLLVLDPGCPRTKLTSALSARFGWQVGCLQFLLHVGMCVCSSSRSVKGTSDGCSVTPNTLLSILYA